MAQGAGPVISQPGKELVGEGKNMKYVKECKELYLGGKGIEKIRGFEPFVNLECLWLNSNKLKKINNLDQNFRIKALYAQDNQICTLKGSLECFHFLETLDLSNNQLRDLDKLVRVLERFKFLKSLNLTGNPCCEEPDYRLLLVHRLPSLRVLDQHVVADMERRKAAGTIGSDVATLTVAFGRRQPKYDPAWDDKVPVKSVLEQELAKEAAAVRDARSAAAYEAETALFRHNPHPEIPRGRTLPPNAGVRKALEAWATASYPGPGQGQDGGRRSGLKPPGSARASQFTSFATTNMSAASASAFFVTQQAHMAAERLGVVRDAVQPSPYVAKDTLTLYNCKPGRSELQEAGTRMFAIPIGGIKFDEDRYHAFVTTRTMGREKWELSKTQLRI
uniref:Uncharacterized protein n=1 Tax=Chlamydomonas leiostraca TaxID=1034604 RepID=A0A7S0WNL5_9CHLO|mmetsp:Transcript_20716/g.52600  ORF Transcript_20716/g.52600 Transcript_20716/m.52600 type:complete len:391 (+) Transcript_20716:211-1383(+)